VAELLESYRNEVLHAKRSAAEATSRLQSIEIENANLKEKIDVWTVLEK
jgi:hypothetical protein